MKKFLFVFLFSFIFVSQIFAKLENDEMVLLFDDESITLNFNLQPELLRLQPKYNFNIGEQNFEVDINGQILTESNFYNFEESFVSKISDKHLYEFFHNAGLISSFSNENVEISLTKNKEIKINGRPRYGYDFDFEALVEMINKALDNKQKFVRVPASKHFSKVIVHPKIREKGIEEILAIGESNFTGSSPERIQNILASIKKFNGHILKKDETFSFNNILESVEAEDGFVEELVIKGNNTEKELGGGVCQVSTTVFRAAVKSGLPIVRRRSHSYAVPYYTPFGLDATIYLDQTDFRFKNDTEGDILIQAFVEEENLYFIFYGKKDDRQVFLEGPFISDYTPAPQPKIFKVDYLDRGDVEELSPSHDGFVSNWVRTIQKDNKTKTDDFISNYKAWPAKILMGV